jgi:nitroimidazol reductase NimA-like FMN-containing flavoprotein (pyridoxamine 5'-phosphate oxidase superfamily)
MHLYLPGSRQFIKLEGEMINREHIPNKPKTGIVSVPDRLKVLNKKQNFGVLATNDKGQPYTSLISFALTPDLQRLIFATPKDTSKYKNIRNTKEVAILIDDRSGTPKKLMATEAVTIIGTARYVRRGKIRNELAAIYLKKHPDLEEFIQSDTTALIVVEATRCIHVGKFQMISVWDCR